jgi:hypothetical protein
VKRHIDTLLTLEVSALIPSHLILASSVEWVVVAIVLLCWLVD